ncbi:MAG: bifunctional folylpolyglutamate synthase/dihydrofolate synthase [Fermentimonas sp.]|nr:bifunctional folylpolyglutamate synthase/dihydrofolate synthase [Fermentimonas sp.]
MNYKETLDYLYRQAPEYQRVGHSAYKEGLDNSLALDEIFDHPHRKFKTIHVGGTNGKGSVSNLLAAILQESGYRVGLYTSPHLIDFRERIRVNGEMIDKDYVIEFVEKYKEQFEPVMPSFFELTMEMAFLYFAEQKVDVAVIEVGLGGRLDSTNIISPDLSIITNIGLDHIKYLGNTLPKIATEKAGIIKKYTPVVIGEIGNIEVSQVFIDKAESVEAPLVFAELYLNNFVADRVDNKLICKSDNFPNLRGQLSGPAQENNARTVLTTVELLAELDYNIPKDSVYKGFENVIEITGLMGRWQLLRSDPKVICDIAHNSHGISYVVERLKSEDFNRLHFIFGMANDKDTDSVMKLLPVNAVFYFTKASVDRALDEKILAGSAANYGLKGDTYPNVSETVKAAIKNADKEDLIFIGGSSFIVADALPLFI